DPKGSDVVIAPEVTALGDDESADITVAPTGLTFSASGHEALAQKQPGEILVSGFGGGFLRRIVSVSEQNGQVTFTTEPARLEDVILKGSFHQEITMAQPAPTSGALPPGLSSSARAVEIPFAFDFGDLSAQLSEVPEELDVRSTGSLSISPTLAIDFAF